MLNVQTGVLPFDGLNRKTCSVPEGLTLQEIHDRLIPYYFGETITVITINGEAVPANMWGHVRPKRNAVVGINVVATGGGGGGGGKNPLKTLVSVAAIVASFYLAPTLGFKLATTIGGMGPVTSGLVTFSTGLVRVGIGLVGQIASSALSSVPSQSAPSRSASSSRAQNVRESPTQFIEGANNAIDPWGVVPINLGVNRMFPKQAALPYTRSQGGNDQYVYQMFTYGFGEVELEDEKIGETSLSDFNNFSRDYALDGNLKDGVDYYTNDVFQEELGVLLSSSYVNRVTQGDTQVVEVDITWTRGLNYYDKKGKLTSASGTINIRYSVSGAGSWTSQSFSVSAATTQPLRRTFRIELPSKNTYDIEVSYNKGSIPTNSVSDQRDATWTALRSIEYVTPVNQTDVSGMAWTIKATDQLNGSVDRYNSIVKTKMLDYDAGSDAWVERISSNPASVFRYVLQSTAFVKRLDDADIDITKLEEWHIYCDSLGLEYNRVIDWDTDIETILNDICAAGFASRYNVDDIYSVIIDNKKPIIKGVVTPKNSWGYKGSIAYPEIPHGLIIEFRNKDKGYQIDERIIYDDGYDESNATLFERIEFASCTNADLAYIYGRRYLSNIKLQPEKHEFYQDPEFLTLKRGDRFTYVNDVILVGVGSGRIQSLTYDDPNNPTEVTGFVVDDTLTIPPVTGLGVRIRYSDASGMIYHSLVATVGKTDTFTFTTPVTLTDYEAGTDDYLQERQMLGALCSFNELGKELDLLVLSVESDKNYNAKVTAINYAPERFTIDQQPIPVFESNVTQPLSFYKPEAPILLTEPLSDSSLLVRNTDGSFTSRMIIALENRNEANIRVYIKARVASASADSWFEPELLLESPEVLVLTGLQDGTSYDFDIQYRRQGANTLYSNPLQLRNVKYIGGSEAPADVATFRIDVADDNVAVLTWQKNTDIDISHYEIRYSNGYSGATWDAAQVLEAEVFENRLTIPFRGGTYLIKAVDYLGTPSENATIITTYDPGQIRNVIETINEHPTFSGVKENVYAVGSELQLVDTAEDGYYYFANGIDLGYVDSVFTSSNLSIKGQFINNIFDMTNVFTEDNIFPDGNNYDIFLSDDIFNIEDLFGVGSGAWYSEIQFRTTTDDPDDSPTWSSWQTLTAGFKEFWKIEFRLLLRSLQPNIAPSVSALTVIGDVPDRVIRDKDLTVPVTGYTLDYDPEFAVSPTVLITLQDGQNGDEIKFTAKTSSGFSFKVYNKVSTSYVERSFDYAILGYGRKS